MPVTLKVTGKPGLVLRKMTAEIQPAMARAILTAAQFAGGKLAEVAVATFPKGKGTLARSFLPAKFVASSKGIAAGALSDLVYADIQDRGGTIKPKTARMLAVPISREAKIRWPRDWPEDALALIKSRSGKLLLIDAKSKSLVVHYVLKETVTLKGRGYIDKAAAESEDEIAEIMEEEIAAAFDAVPGVTKGTTVKKASV